MPVRTAACKPLCTQCCSSGLGTQRDVSRGATTPAEPSPGQGGAERTQPRKVYLPLGSGYPCRQWILSLYQLFKTRNQKFSASREKLTTEYAALQRRNQLYSASALVSIPHPLQMHNLFHINTMQTVKRTATEHTSSESKNMDPLAKKGRIRTEGQIYPPQQSTLLPFTHIVSPVCIWKVLTLTFFFFLKKEIRQHKH